MAETREAPLAFAEVLAVSLKCARRRSASARTKMLSRLEPLVHLALQRVREVDLTAAARLEYEFGMLAFGDRRFLEAYDLMVRAEFYSPIASSSGFLISASQARVSAWEQSLREAHASVSPVNELSAWIPELDRAADEPNALLILKTWRVTARLHLTRMLAYLGRCDEAAHYYRQAEDIREASDAASGWQSYTRVLLLHARGEMLRCQGDPAAAQVLGLAGYRILSDGKYKNYEYIENVFTGLLAVPEENIPIDLRSSLEDLAAAVDRVSWS